MATYAAPSLAGNSLPGPSNVEVRREYRGGRQILADGTMVTDLIDGDPKLKLIYEWAYTTDISGIQAGYDAIKNTPGLLNHVDGAVLSVTIDNSSPDLKYSFIKVASGLIYKDVRLSMREA